MKQIFRKLWNYSPAQICAILRSRLAVPDFVSGFEIEPKELERLQKLPRYAGGQTVFMGKRFEFIDASSYLSMLDEIFGKQNYSFTALRNDPFIIDCGSNIGVSIIYFKSIYPSARVIGFEPGKKQFVALEKNLKNFGYDDVKIHDKAVWTSDGTLDFHNDGSWGGKIESAPGNGTVKVESKRLKDLLGEKVDFLKIDIEGGETAVLEDCASSLWNVENMFIEYHSDAVEPQTLDRILSIISKSGMRYHIKEAAQRKRPFVNKIKSGFDSQLEIYAFRD